MGIVNIDAKHFDATCAGCVERLLKTQPGVLNTVVDCQSRSFSIEYDSRIISDERVAHVAHRFAPQLRLTKENTIRSAMVNKKAPADDRRELFISPDE